MVPAVVLVDVSQAAASLHPAAGGHTKTLSARPSNSDNFVSLFLHIPPSPGAQRGGGGGVRARRCDAPLRISPTPGERGAGLPGFVGVGSCLLSISRSISALLGEISAITESPQVNLIRVDGPAARKGAGVKFTPASLRLRICGLCGHGRAAQGEPNRLSRLNHHSQKP